MLFPKNSTAPLKPKIVIACFLSLTALALITSLLYAQTKYNYRLAICAMFKNEAPWLKEWITYHHEILGADRFYLYNNDSTDNCAEVLRPFIEKGIVELIDWNTADETHRINGVADHTWFPYQLGAYNDCIKNRALGKAKWVAMIDIDEFIVPVRGVAPFYHYLRQMEKRRKGTIKLKWRIFGTSNVWDLSEGELLTEKLTLRSEDSHPWHQWVKSIHRPEAIEFCQIHDNPKMAPRFRTGHADPDEFRIHHYWTRTEKACRAKRHMTKEESVEFFKETNRIEDKAILQYIPTLKRVISEIQR